MNYKKFDKEVVVLCKAMNRINGIRTIDSCCGHGKTPFHIYFKATDINESHQGLPVLLYYLDFQTIRKIWSKERRRNNCISF
jgi:hypothetical protein